MHLSQFVYSHNHTWLLVLQNDGKWPACRTRENCIQNGTRLSLFKLHTNKALLDMDCIGFDQTFVVCCWFILSSGSGGPFDATVNALSRRLSITKK